MSVQHSPDNRRVPSLIDASQRARIIAALEDARARELRAAQLYRLLGNRQTDAHKREIFYRLADEESRHARQFGERITAHGGSVAETIPPLKPTDRLLARTLGTEAMLRRMEAEEERNITAFNTQAGVLEADPVSRALFEEIEREEESHSRLLQTFSAPDTAARRLEAMLKHEKWHVSTGSWIGDAIYGVNDGLTAVFGIVSGTAAYTGGSHQVIFVGLLATLASALSMGSSAFLATKSEKEIYEAEIGRERQEIEESPEHEVEELALLYQLKGLSEEEARRMATTIAAQPEQFLKTMAQEELGLSEHNFPNPWLALLSGTVSTAIGGLTPMLPFFFATGPPAVIAAAIVATIAHFAVGAAKSLVTARHWFASGMEMTVVGVVVGMVTYVLGVVFKVG